MWGFRWILPCTGFVSTSPIKIWGRHLGTASPIGILSILSNYAREAAADMLLVGVFLLLCCAQKRPHQR